MFKRRQLLRGTGTLLGAVGALFALNNKTSAAEIANEKTQQHLHSGLPPARANIKTPYRPVLVPGVKTLPYTMKNGVKEFHLIAEPVKREFAPGMTVNCWGYNGSTPGPTIEAVEGDRVRILVSNRLPEQTSVHWHGLFLPNGMDGVAGLTQPHIPPGKTFAYEFTLNQNGTFMYHSHSDEMLQMALGMMGFFIVHPKDAAFRPVDRDYAFMLMSWDINPGTYTPNPATMTDFNTWSMNSLVFPAVPSMVARTGERVRIRIANLSMTNHPMHLHGHRFFVTGTDGGWIAESAQWPEVSSDVPVGAIRVIEFDAALPGDWAFHCHKSHHTMGPMNHAAANMLGVRQQEVMPEIEKLLPDYMLMPMGSNGMGEMGEMAMPLPENTLPMMTGTGPFGAIEMGGMFTMIKIRDDVRPNDETDPGWYRHPRGSVAYAVDL